jgi:hypothetical protein
VGCPIVHHNNALNIVQYYSNKNALLPAVCASTKCMLRCDTGLSVFQHKLRNPEKITKGEKGRR